MNTAALLLCLLSTLQDGDASPAGRIAALVPDLASSDAGKVDAAWTNLERICFQAGRPGAEAERKAVASAIAAQLGDDVPVPARIVLLRALEIAGKGEAVAPLAKLLAAGGDPALREGARRALEANPHVNAKRELRTALRQADGVLRLGIIRSLGARRDFLATADLISIAEESDFAPRLAAIEALAEIGDISAVPVVEKALAELKGSELAAVERAYLRLADSLVRNGERGQARRAYDRAAGFSPAFRAAALIGFARADLQSEVGRIVEALSDADAIIRGAAGEAAATIAGDAMTRALIEKVGAGAGAPAMKALARRPGADARSALLAAAKAASGSARDEAIRILGQAAPGPGADAVAAFLLAELGGPNAAAAEEAFGRAGDPPAAAAALASASGDRQLALIRFLGARRARQGVQPLLSILPAAPAGVRAAAFTALGQIGDESSAAPLVTAISTAKDAELDAAINALARLKGAGVAAQVSAALANATGPARAALLRVTGMRQDPGALETLRAAAADADPGVRHAAVIGLARSSDPAVLPLLLAAAGKETGDARRAAVEGALRLANALAAGDRQEAVQVYVTALALAAGDASIRTALHGLAETGDAAALQHILPFLKPGAVQRDAGRAALRLAERLPDAEQAGARTVYEQVLAANPDDATARQCVRRLRRLGVEVDFARQQGFVTRWWIAGPFPNPQGVLWDKALSPEAAVDLAAGLEHDGKKHEWKPYHTPSPRGLVDLDEAGYGSGASGAYLYAEITLPAAIDAVLKLGSDDQIACWLNGVKVHANRVSRGLDVDQDSVAVRLPAGVNRILLKVLNDGGGWGACLRVTRQDGTPLPVDQRRE